MASRMSAYVRAVIIMLALSAAVLRVEATSRGEAPQASTKATGDAPACVSGCNDMASNVTLASESFDSAAESREAIYKGRGAGTYYFDVKTCCSQDRPRCYPETDGYPACTSFTPGPKQQTLRQLNSNNVVAIDADLVAGDRKKYCGKKIRVFRNNQEVKAPDGGDFFVWDGCAACRGGGRIDFSVSGLRNAADNACNLGVVPGISWVVTDKQVKKFVY